MARLPFLLCALCAPLALVATASHSGQGVWKMSQNVRENIEAIPLSPSEPKQSWKYVDVRTHAHMFWWLYYTTASHGYKNRPLILWLQGGPGGSSTGFGNFAELGPLDQDLKPRNTTWLSEASLLFIDNPVGTGYSYVTDDSAYVTDLKGIVQDLITTLKSFFKDTPDFQTIPFYIFSESYGGKMTAGLAQGLQQAIKSGSVQCDFQGFAMGDSWISPLDSVLTWGPYLYATSVVDEKGLSAINKSAVETQEAFEAGKYKQSTSLWSQTENVIESVSAGINFYNILQWGESSSRQKHSKQMESDALYGRHVAPMHNDPLSDLMNGPIRKKLGVIPKNVTWGGQSQMVFQKMSVDFMKPVINIVDDILKTSAKLKVVVYSGQLDLICDTLGTELWVQKLTWPGLPFYNNSPRKPFQSPTAGMAGFVKRYHNFSFYWIMKAGHMVPKDAGAAALEMVRNIINTP